MKILVAGGAGYVGSHAVRTLIGAGHDVVVLDNLCAGHAAAVAEQAQLVVGDLEDAILLDELFSFHRFDAVLHFAAFIEVGESVVDPLKFYANNVGNSVRLLSAMQRHEVRRFVFSSTCATYGTPEKMPIVETTHQNPQSPYARAKLVVEWALADSASAWGLGFVALRYFNAAGAAADATIGEDHDPETHLIPNVLMVPLGKRKEIKIFGTDYKTPDGTCIRDYVHVDDLADAHRLAIEAVVPGQARWYNAGTGRGSSVREVIEAARKVTGHAIPTVELPRRAGDVPELVADSALIRRDLGWTPRHTTLEGIVASAWKWHQSHPEGFDDRPRADAGGTLRR